MFDTLVLDRIPLRSNILFLGQFFEKHLNSKEYMKRISFLLLPILTTVGVLADNAQIYDRFKKSVIATFSGTPGWCSKQKANAMMDLIFETKPAVCVEIGVFAGASLLPTASALKHIGRGIVYGIDPWATHECVKYFPEVSPHRTWWSKIDLNSMFNFCNQQIRIYRLEKNCILIKKSGENAAGQIGQIDILHIDANHCDQSDLGLVRLYIPKVKVGGYIWFDGYASSSQAFEYVKNTCYVEDVIDQGGCILLKKYE